MNARKYQGSAKPMSGAKYLKSLRKCFESVKIRTFGNRLVLFLVKIYRTGDS